MKVLVVGSGGREHALCWAISRSALCDSLFCAPGNAGIAQVATCVPLNVEDVPAVVQWVKDNAIEFVVVGPEAPLVLGLVDALAAEGIKAFGPKAGAAALEGSKGFMKDVLRDAGVPTAWYGRFTDIDSAKAFVREKGAPIVVKTDGLAAGKGVILCQSVAEAEQAIDEMMGDKVFGDAGNELVIEEFLVGEEASFFAIADGETAIALVAAQDHKAVGDGDTGPNTGGMGAYSPAPVFTDAIRDQVMETCILPTVRHMKAIGHPYTGVLFCGLMITANGPKVLEYNVRFGDPECQVLMMRLQSDVLATLLAAAEGRLGDIVLDWSDDTAMVVVMAAEGYPGSYLKGSEIKGLDAANAVDNAIVFHAGTKTGPNGEILANGGRVLGVAARGATVRAAQASAYQAVDALDWPKGFCRRDIGWRAVAREQHGE